MTRQLENIRRQAFVNAIEASRQKAVVSIFGKIPWEIISSFDLLAVRPYGIDYYVVEEEDLSLCSMLNSTLEYKRLDKCPFMSVSSLYIVDQFCPLRQAVIENYFSPHYVYEDFNSLIEFLEQHYQQTFNLKQFNHIIEQSAYVSELIISLRQSDLSPSIINQLTYYQQFIFNLEERIRYLEDIIKDIKISKEERKTVRVGQLAGIGHHLGDSIMISGKYCEEENHILSPARSFDFLREKYELSLTPDRPTDFNVNRCPLYPQSYLKYEGEI